MLRYSHSIRRRYRDVVYLVSNEHRRYSFGYLRNSEIFKLGKKRRVLSNSGPVQEQLAYWPTRLKALVAMGRPRPSDRRVSYAIA